MYTGLWNYKWKQLANELREWVIHSSSTSAQKSDSPTTYSEMAASPTVTESTQSFKKAKLPAPVEVDVIVKPVTDCSAPGTPAASSQGVYPPPTVVEMTSVADYRSVALSPPESKFISAV